MCRKNQTQKRILLYLCPVIYRNFQKESAIYAAIL